MDRTFTGSSVRALPRGYRACTWKCVRERALLRVQKDQNSPEDSEELRLEDVEQSAGVHRDSEIVGDSAPEILRRKGVERERR